MTDRAHEDLTERFLVSFGRAARAMNLIMKPEMERHDITWPQFGLMKAVKRHEPVTVTELSQHLGISAPTASKMIDGLCEKEMLEKAKDASDHRVTRISLTTKSRRLIRKLTIVQHDLMSRTFEGENPAELEILVGKMQVISEKWLRMAAAEAGVSNYHE